MTVADIPSDRVVLILGAPRSGTSWLAKIFDSHPDVLYRHEPDTILRNHDLPWMCSAAEAVAFRDSARAYLRELLTVATLKTSGSLPIFPKRFHGPLRFNLRSGLIYGLRIAEKIGARRAVRGARIPDLVDANRYPALRVVLKSVSSRGRARLFADALTGMRIIFIVRDPWGQVASMLRGSALGMFEDKVPIAELLATEQAQRYGLTGDRLAAMPAVEQFAWNWAILNEKAIDDLKDADHVRVLRYQDLCERPADEAHELFDFARLSWDAQTEEFIRRSTTFSGRERYYQVFKNTRAALYRWRQELTLDDQRRILGVVRQTSLLPLCPDL